MLEQVSELKSNRAGNPFQEFYTATHTPKVFDIEFGTNATKREPTIGKLMAKVRVLAFVPRKESGHGLTQIHVTAAWCHPFDYLDWNKKKANMINYHFVRQCCVVAWISSSI